MRSNNRNEAITHLAMPERQIPVLIDSSLEKAVGFVPSMAWVLKGSGMPGIAVRLFLPASLNDLSKPQQRREAEKEYGPISQTQWNGLLSMLALIDRWNAGDRRPEVEADEETARELEDVFFGQSVIHVRQLSPEWAAKTHSVGMDADFAITAKFTAGLRKARFVVWRHKHTGKFVPGLYCPDIMTALYASVLYGLGTPGGLGVCQRCGNPFIRSRTKQQYCDHRCQVAAGMRRYRATRELKAQAKSKTTTKGKKRAGRN
jgi:hypothetical protein